LKAAIGLMCGLLLLTVSIEAMAENQSSSPREALLWRMALTEQVALEQSHPLVQNEQLDDYLKRLVSRLWKLVETDLPPMTIRVIKNSDPNAVVYANGICYLTSGMLALTECEDQLAMIIAHEMVHYIRRDSLETFNRNQASEGTPTESGETYAAAAERRADLEGMGMILQAGYCPQEIVNLLSGFQGAKLSHPFSAGASPMSFGERIAGIETLLAREAIGLDCHASSAERTQFNIHTAPALLADAETALQRGVWGAADRSIARYLKMVPHDPQAYYVLGEIRLRRPVKDLQGAMAAYETAIDLDHAFIPAYRALGVLHLKAGHLHDARQYLEYCLAIAPQAPENAYIRGYLQLCQD
jgi:beta-barrel assembly-enhancing protease